VNCPENLGRTPHSLYGKLFSIKMPNQYTCRSRPSEQKCKWCRHRRTPPHPPGGGVHRTPPLFSGSQWLLIEGNQSQCHFGLHGPWGNLGPPKGGKEWCDKVDIINTFLSRSRTASVENIGIGNFHLKVNFHRDSAVSFIWEFSTSFLPGNFGNIPRNITNSLLKL
jgi:hypothetical protein